MTRIKTVSREKYLIFKGKSDEFYSSMNDAFEREHYNACVSNAVHCAISAVDALAVRKIGQKSSEQSHGNSIMLLKEVKTSDEKEKSRICDKIYRLTELKSPSEYQDRCMSKSDATLAVSLCKNIYEFITKELETETI
jgi:HEPN domain-containing protein